MNGDIVSFMRTRIESLEITLSERNKQIEAARNEIARLRELVKEAYDEGYIASSGDRGNIVSNWDHSRAKAALDGEVR